MNVYQKGALIGMCLDIILRRESGGNYGIQNLMKDLAKEYGKQKPFPDDQLFEIIGKLTYPEAEKFLRNCVGGPQPLPLDTLLGQVGIDFKESGYEKGYSLGGVDFRENRKGEIYVDGMWGIDEFGEAVGYQEGDILISLNGKAINGKNFTVVFLSYMLQHEEGDDFILLVKRRVGKNKYKKTELKTQYRMVMHEVSNQLKTMENPSPEQLKLRQDWLGNYRTE
jgi:predicted metalloprotease with PDZ domain